MVERRRNTPFVGPLLACATFAAERHPALSWPMLFVRSIPKKVRFIYRHGHKLLVRFGRTAQLPSRIEIRRTFGTTHEPASLEMSDREKWIYQRLCEALDRSASMTR
jgi:hypothetical protein